MNKKRHISFSEYRLWNQCSFKHYLTKTLGYSEPSNEFLVFGSALHATIEEIAIKKSNRITYEGIMRKKLEEEASGITMSSFFQKKLVSQGLAILKEIDLFERFKDYEIVGVEKEIYEPLFVDENTGETIHFKGIVDMVLKKKDSDEYIILDWKTAMKPWDIDKKKQDKTFFCQLALYKHFFAKINGVPLDKIDTRFVVLVRDPASVETVEVSISEDFMVFTLQDIIRTAQEILLANKDNVIKAKSSEETKANCQYCFFHKNKVCDNNNKQEIGPYVKQIINNE